jgi:hypothetical protein
MNRVKFSVCSNLYLKLFHRFDSAFYLICNPDVVNYLPGPFDHWKKYGVKEYRTSLPNNCIVSDCNISLDQIYSAINGLDKLILSRVSSILSSKIYQVPWRPGIAGFPSKIISITLKLEGAPRSTFFVLNNCKLIFRRRNLNKYEILLNYDQL